MRLDKFLANAGLGTRKEVKAILKEGRVFVNDVLCKSDKTPINESLDVIKVDDQIIEYRKYYYILINKPAGYVSSTMPERNYPPITDLVYEFDFASLFPVGRLDVDTTGTLLLTNHGTLAHKLISPKYHVDKIYNVTTDFPIQVEMIDRFKKGMILDGEKLLPATLEILDTNHGRVTLHQGKYHQVKRMFDHYGLKVIKLQRDKFAFLSSLDMKEGEYRQLTPEEIKKLLLLVNESED